jgi:acetylornithine deacetylase/succinyl-diaminopimelate desuccinylase-like protein
MAPAPHVLAEWVARLVRIPSVNPLHVGAHSQTPGELALAMELAERFESFGASEVVLDEVTPGRPNLYALFPGRTERLVVLDAHLDTVTVENMTDPPFDGRIHDGHVWGRGSLDTKASLGVISALLESWATHGLRPEPTLLVVGTISEEAGGLIGAAQFRRWAEDRELDVDQMIVCEPTSCAPVHGHKGGIGLRITVHGKSAHSSTPDEGRNAIVAAARIVLALQAHHEELVRGAASTAVGTGTLLTSTITGGIANNVVPDRCVLTVGRRIAPGENPEVEQQRIISIAREASSLPFDVEPIVVGSPAFFQSPESELVRLLAAATGESPACAPFGTNALRYDSFAREKVVFGPGRIEDAHQARECVRIDDLVRIAHAYTAWLRPS